jgi:hypothetical protein
MYMYLIEKFVRMCHEMIEEFKICDFSFWRKKKMIMKHVFVDF